MFIATHRLDCSSPSDVFGLDQWETDGGAIRASGKERSDWQALPTEPEAQILQRLGAALLSQWNGLPTAIQRELFKHSIDIDAPRQVTPFKMRVARFLHDHKDDAGGAK